MSEIGKLIGERIRNIRKQKGLSQEELGGLCNLHPKYISSVERAEKNVSLEAIDKIAVAFGMSLEELFHNLQPSNNTEDESARQLYNLMNELSLGDQSFILDTVKKIVEWKKS